MNKRLATATCLLLTLFLIPTLAHAAPTRVNVTFAAAFIDTDPTRVDTVHAGGKVVEFYWEGTGGVVTGDIAGTIGEWTSSSRAFYSQAYDPNHIDNNRLRDKVNEVFTVPTTVDSETGTLTIEVRYKIDWIELSRKGTWLIVDSSGGLEGARGHGTYSYIYDPNDPSAWPEFVGTITLP